MTRFERWMLVASSLVTGVTGFVYAWMKYLMTTDDPYAVVNHPLQPVVLKIHIVAAPLLVFALGLIFMQHVLRHWRSGQRVGRLGGATLVLTSAPMIPTTAPTGIRFGTLNGTRPTPTTTRISPPPRAGGSPVSSSRVSMFGPLTETRSASARTGSRRLEMRPPSSASL